VTLQTATKQILIIEDNPGDAQLIREVFGEISNVLWHFAENVVQARDFIHRRHPHQGAPRPDLIILDLNLPIFRGQSLISELKADPRFCAIRIVVLTSSPDRQDRDLCLRLGADDFVIKPRTLPDWTAAMRRILQAMY
jgi:CheY-like chemotaxis protein